MPPIDICLENRREYVLCSYDRVLLAIDREVDNTELQLTINRLFALVWRDSTLDSAIFDCAATYFAKFRTVNI